MMYHRLPTNSRQPEQRQLLTIGSAAWVERCIRDPLAGRAEKIVEAASIEEAMHYIAVQNVDIVMLEASEPGCARNVETLIERFDVPVLAIGEDDSVDAALVAGATDFVTEPVSRAVLVRRLDLVLETAISPLLADDVASPYWTDELRSVNSHEQAAHGLAHWELCRDSGDIVWSPSLTRLLGSEVASHCVTLLGFKAQLADTDRRELEVALQRLANGESSELAISLKLNSSGGSVEHYLMLGEAIAGDGLIFGTLSKVQQDDGLDYEKRLREQDIDAVTQLPRQTAFLYRLGAMLDRLVTGMTSVLVLDLPTLPKHYSSFGQEVGDALMLSITARLQEALPPESLISVIGKHRFAIALENLPSTNVVQKTAEKVRSRLREIYYFDEQPILLDSCVGISVSSCDAAEPTGLLSCACDAADIAIAEGQGTLHFYCDKVGLANNGQKQQLCMEGHLHNAIDNGELELYYQPQVDINRETIIGMEALLRWTNPQLGRVAPNLFIPIAEEIGLINKIGEWVLTESARQMAIWQAAGLGSIRVSVNLSPLQLGDDSVVKQLKAVTERYEVPVTSFDLEVTETTGLTDADGISAQLKRMRDMGATVSLDDFGTRHSALSHLSSLEVDTLKIDRSFVNEIKFGQASAVTDAIFAIANSLDKNVVAEGVETEEQLGYLRSKGCQNVQGFLFCEPVDASEATKLLRSGYNGLLERQSVLRAGQEAVSAHSNQAAADAKLAAEPAANHLPV